MQFENFSQNERERFFEKKTISKGNLLGQIGMSFKSRFYGGILERNYGREIDHLVNEHQAGFISLKN